MPDIVDCTEGDIRQLVDAFYGRVRRDPALGPIFEARVADWDEHLAKLTDFWSAILRRTGRFSGSPMAAHARLDDLDASLFLRWLELFRETAASQAHQVMAEQACAAAERIADSLWMGYQISRGGDGIPTPLPRPASGA